MADEAKPAEKDKKVENPQPKADAPENKVAEAQDGATKALHAELPGAKPDAAKSTTDTAAAKPEGEKDKPGEKPGEKKAEGDKEGSDTKTACDLANEAWDLMREVYCSATKEIKDKGIIGFALPDKKLFGGTPKALEFGKSGDVANLKPSGKLEFTETATPVAAAKTADAPAKSADAPAKAGDAPVAAAKSTEADKDKSVEVKPPEEKSWWSGAIDGTLTFASNLYEDGKQCVSTGWNAVKEYTKEQFSNVLKNDGQTFDSYVSKDDIGSGKVSKVESSAVVKNGGLESVSFVKEGENRKVQGESISWTKDGLSYARNWQTGETAIKTEGGDTLNVKKDTQTLTKANGDVVVKDKDGYLVTNTKDGITYRVNQSGKLDAEFAELGQVMDRVDKTREEWRRENGGVHGKDGDSVRVQDGVQTTDANATTFRSNDGKIIEIDGRRGEGKVRFDLEHKTVTMTGKDGKPHEMSFEEFAKQHPHGFARWQMMMRNGRMEAKSEDGSKALTTSSDGQHTTIDNTVVTGPNAGKKLVVDGTESGANIKVTQANGDVVRDMTINDKDKSHYISDRDPKTGQLSVIDTSTPGDIKYTAYKHDREDPKDILAALSNDTSYLDGLCVDNESGDAWYEDPFTGEVSTIYDSSDEAYFSSQSEAHSAAATGSKVAGEVSSAASSGKFDNAYVGKAIDAIGDIDSAIGDCIAAGNVSGLGNLISAKAACISALGEMNRKTDNNADALKAGLSSDQAFRVSQTGSGSDVHRAIMEEQERSNPISRTRPAWN